LFLSVQGFLFSTAVPNPAIKNAGWFLNSGRGAIAVGLACAIAGALIGIGRRDMVREATMLASGAVLAMVAVLFSIGSGSIFPIVIVFGAVIIVGPMTTGTLVGAGVRRALGVGNG